VSDNYPRLHLNGVCSTIGVKISCPIKSINILFNKFVAEVDVAVGKN